MIRGALISSVVIALALTGFWMSSAYDALTAAAPPLPVNFAHKDHQEQNCVDCHHEFVDDTGGGLCFDCHERSPEVGHLLETQFHDLCRTCHIEQAMLGEEHGPTRHCEGCHVADPFP